MGQNSKRRITANLPADLLNEATRLTQLGVTETLILGLKMVKRSQAAEKAKALKGSLHLDVDLSLSRERAPR